MVRHISIFFIKEGKNDEEIRRLKKTLIDCTESIGAEMYVIGTDCLKRPEERFPGIPEFGDIVQILDFADRADAKAYPENPAHLKLMREIGNMIEKVAAIDIEIGEECEEELEV